jgi:hypothetical protein
LRVRLERCGRLPKGISLPAALVLLWAALVLLTAWVERRTGGRFETCLFLRATGHPCPTCGSTRALFAWLQGEWGSAFRWNPLAALAFPALGLAGALRLGLGRCLRLHRDRREARLLLIAGLAALAANWAWVLTH